MGLQAQGAPASLPVGETGGANGGTASRGTGCRAFRPATRPVLAQPEAGRKPIRSAPGAEPQAMAARQRGAKVKAARSLRARRCMAGSAVERPAARGARPQGRTRRRRGTRRDRARPPAAHRLGALRGPPRWKGSDETRSARPQGKAFSLHDLHKAQFFGWSKYCATVIAGSSYRWRETAPHSDSPPNLGAVI